MPSRANDDINCMACMANRTLTYTNKTGTHARKTFTDDNGVVHALLKKRPLSLCGKQAR